MSSRTATGRKRLGDPTRQQPLAKSFFSRTKPQLPQVSSPPSSYPSLPQSDPYLHHHHRGADQSYLPHSQNVQLDLREEYPPLPSTVPFGVTRPHSTLTFSQSTATVPRKTLVVPTSRESAYPSTSKELHNAYDINQDAPPSHASLFPTSQIPTVSGPAVIEASYQPPPPIHSRSDGCRSNSNKSLASSVPLERIPQLPSYPPPSPPRGPSHAIPPFLSQSHPTPSPPHSPASTELPAYASHIERFSQVPVARPGPKILTPDPSRGYLQPWAPLQQETGFSSREHLDQAQSPSSPSTDSHSPTSDSDKRPWFRNLRAPQPTSSAPISPIHETLGFPLSSHPGQGPRSPESVSGSSGSGSSIISNGAPATFIFPGSRSVARPKASNKISSRNKSRGGKDANHLPSTNSEVQQWPSGIVGSTLSNDVIHITHTTHPRPPPSVISSDGHSAVHSAFSDDDGVPRRTRSIGETSPSDSQAAFVFPTSRSRAQPKRAIKAKSLARKRSRKFSSNTEGSDTNEQDRITFMNKFLRKKKSKASTSGSNTVSSGSDSLSDRNSETEAPQEISLAVDQPTRTSLDRTGASQQTIDREREERARRFKSRIGNYPLDPYDSVLLDNDRHTGELLFRLNPTGSPTFHHYGTTPPSTVLDLGCGQGHWVIDAAIAWKGHGTQVTGYDMVDISKGLLPWASKQGVIENVRFIRGNFLKQRLPFSDDSFELVRMSCLSLCIPSDSWPALLQEICRVLMIGGRLELIDDETFFPYGKATSTVNVAGTLPDLGPPQLDISIPSSSFSTFSIYEGGINNPGLGGLEGPSAAEMYGLYGVQEEEDADIDDTATIHGSVEGSMRSHINRPGISYRAWNQAYDTSRDLEALFDHMLEYKFGIRKVTHESILNLMQDAFGHAREVKTMHLTLALPDSDDDNDEPRGRQQSANGSELTAGHRDFLPRTGSTSRRQSMGLSQTHGLILWPSTFLPMDQSEIEIHASKHLRMLLSCKKLLIEHALEVTDDEEIDEDSIMEALWEYEGFLRHRLIAPPFDSCSAELIDQLDDNASLRGSIAESVSSDSRDAMLEIQSELCQRFVWRSSSVERHLQTPTPPAQQDTPARPLTHPPTSIVNPTPSTSDQAFTRSRREIALSSMTATPIYSRNEMTHVRTFRVYEAIKIDESIFGTAI